jgi:hypothetical protein
MPAKERSIATGWTDPDDAPEWTDAVFERAAVHHGDILTQPAQGTQPSRPPEAGKPQAPGDAPPRSGGRRRLPRNRSGLAGADQ